MKILFGVLLFLCLIVIFSNHSGTSTNDAPTQANVVTPHVPKDPQSCLTLVSHKFTAEEYSESITGTIKNNCDRRFGYVQITFKLYDEHDNVIGTALANQSSLDAGETWKFKAHCFVSPRKFALDGITAY